MMLPGVSSLPATDSRRLVAAEATGRRIVEMVHEDLRPSQILTVAAFDNAIRYAQQRTAFGKPIAQHQAVQLMLADMGTRLQAAKLMVEHAAQKKDAGERCDVEAGMAKLFASEACAKMTLDAMRVLGGYGFMAEFPVERYYRDAPLMMIGEGTNEIQALVIARGLIARNPV